MNERIKELAKQAGAYWHHGDFNMGSSVEFQESDLEKFANSIIYDFLSELTNDDSLGEARIETIKRLAEKWGVARKNN